MKAQVLFDLTQNSGTTPILGLSGGTIYDNGPATTYTYSGNGYAYAHSGNTGFIADQNPGTAEDTYYYDFGNTVNSSYVGFSFASKQYHYGITALTVSFRMDGDGGWFGVNGQRPGGLAGDNSATLGSGNYLVTPQLQYTLNGTTWVTDTSATSNYLTVLGARTEGSGNTPNVTFNFSTPVYGVEGVRLIGTNGGTSGSAGGGNAGTGLTGGGFVALDEESIAAVVPEPSTYATLGLGLAVLAFIGRLRRQSRCV